MQVCAARRPVGLCALDPDDTEARTVDYPHYDPASAVTPLSAAELDALDALLQALPADGVMSLDGVDGYLTALVVGPPAMLAALPTADWLPLVWGGDDDDVLDGGSGKDRIDGGKGYDRVVNHQNHDRQRRVEH